VGFGAFMMGGASVIRWMLLGVGSGTLCSLGDETYGFSWMSPHGNIQVCDASVKVRGELSLLSNCKHL
jgi:hypothetical protein